METTEKINVSGTMKALEVGGVLVLEKKLYRLSSVRVTANSLKQDMGLGFTVSVSGSEITIERVK